MSRDEKQLLYAESHEWVDVTEVGGAKVAVVGISAFAIEQLNDLVYMDLPAVGRVLTRGEEFGEVESVKAVSPLYAPVGGEILEVHSDLAEHLDRLKEDPYEFGWIMKVKITDEDAIGLLLDHAAYEKQCSESS